jgi:hypothetical protein
MGGEFVSGGVNVGVVGNLRFDGGAAGAIRDR